MARARWLDPGLGRFTGEDPVDIINLYAYVGNQPVDFLDPTGESAAKWKFAMDLCAAIISFANVVVGDGAGNDAFEEICDFMTDAADERIQDEKKKSPRSRSAFE